MAVVRQATQVQLQTVLMAQVGHAYFASLQSVPPRTQQWQVDITLGQQQTHLFKGFAQRGHHVVQTALGQPQLGANRRVVRPQAQAVGQAIAGVQHATREDRSAAAQITVALGAAQHQHLHGPLPVFAIAQQEQ